MPSITSITGRVCYNSRGQETVEIDVMTDQKYLGRTCAPSGASVGKYEVVNFPKNKVDHALQMLNSNINKFIGLEASDTETIFDTLRTIDDTSDYSKVGGAIAYALSIAAVDSAAKALNVPMLKVLKKNGIYRFPIPLGNVLGGGAHAGPGTPDIQEFLVVPIGAKSINEALRMNFEVHRELKNVIEHKDKEFTYGRGDEGAWAPKMNDVEALDAVEKACNNCGFKIDKDIAMGVDFATSSLWDENSKSYVYIRSGRKFTSARQIEFVSNVIKDYKLIYAEDPVHEEAFEDMAELTKRFRNVYVTGDDLLVTNVERLEKAKKYNACNAAILKVNQAGSLHDAMDFSKKANENNIRLITSHRSGESIDTHLVHIAIATNSKMIKSGVLGGERISKLNEMLRLSETGLMDGMAEV
ncbi:MAG: enolase [Thaumarchaeota archaeon]|nr:enolase [Nitrososphaerota archaeon]|tara:strand:- start:1833 stop:3071 length:1239 start_codon:yes stop_codon:yes gene_type:complete